MPEHAIEIPPDVEELLKEKEAHIAKLERKNEALTNLLKQEITHKESISKALRFHLNKSENLINAVPWIVLQLSSKGTYVEVNRYFAALFNDAPTSFADKPLGSFGEPLIFTSALERFIHSEETDVVREQVYFDKEDVQQFYLLLLFRNKISGHSSVIGIDITDRVQAKVELLATQSRLQITNATLANKVKEAEELASAAHVASEAKSNFLSAMSHELRTPLNGIIGMASLLGSYELDEDLQECVDVILSSADSLLGVISHILDLSKIEAGKIELEHIRFNLKALILDLKRIFTFLAQEKNIDFEVALDPALPIHVQGDPVRLKQVLTNLINNALKFTEKGSIALSLSIEKHCPKHVHILFSVQDTGIGISEEAKKNLFQPFFQADSSTTRNYGGTGLGLTICKEFVELMQGSISVDSEPQKGSRFFFTARLEKG